MIVGVGMLANRQAYERLIGDFLKNAALLYLGGIFALVVGLLIVLTHNVWKGGWPAVITVFGWISIVKGAWLLVFPDTAPGVIKAYQKRSPFLLAQAAILILIGLGLTIFGYFG
jgi:hypothetical protein